MRTLFFLLLSFLETILRLTKITKKTGFDFVFSGGEDPGRFTTDSKSQRVLISFLGNLPLLNSVARVFYLLRSIV